MTTISKQPDAESRISARERADVLLDEALMESFPASDSCSISPGTRAIKQDYFQRNSADTSTAQSNFAKNTYPTDKRAP